MVASGVTARAMAASVTVAACLVALTACSDDAPGASSSTTGAPPVLTLVTSSGGTIEVLGAGELPFIEIDGPIAVHGPYYACSNDDVPTPPVDCGQNAGEIVGDTVLALRDGCVYVDDGSGQRYSVVFEHGTRWDAATLELVGPDGERYTVGAPIHVGSGTVFDRASGRLPPLLAPFPEPLVACARAADHIYVTSYILGL